MSAQAKRLAEAKNITLASLINLIAIDPGLPEEKKRRWTSAIRGIARALDRAPGTLPANPTELTKRLSKVRGIHHRAQVAKSTWKSYLTEYRASTRHVGLANGPARIDIPRSEAWRELLASRPRSDRNFLSRFAGLMTQRGIEPDRVTEASFAAYRQYLQEAAVQDPERAYDGTCWAWGRVQTALPGLPRFSPSRAYRRTAFWRPWSDFPPTLEGDIDAMYRSWSKPVAFSVETLFSRPLISRKGRRQKPIKPATVHGYKNFLQALASAAVEAGVPTEHLTSLEILVSPAIHQPALEWLIKRRLHDTRQRGVEGTDDRLMRGKYVYGIAHHVRTILSRQFHWSDEQLERLDNAISALAPADNRMSQRTRERLAILREPHVFRALFQLPERLFRELREAERPTTEKAWTAATGLLLAIDLDSAFRRSNAIKLKLEGHFGPLDPRTGRMLIEVPPEETKTDLPYIGELRARTVKLLNEYIENWRPLLATEPSAYLFPLTGLASHDQNVEQVALRGFAHRLTRLVNRRLDVPFNLHLLRSLLATLYAEANPGDDRTAQLKLGHASEQTTQRYYLDPRQREANRRFDAAIDRLLDPGITNVPVGRRS